MKRLLAIVALSLIGVFGDVAMPPVQATTWACTKWVGTDGNYWAQWSFCNGLEQNDKKQRIRGKFCTWWDESCYVFSGPWRYQDSVWSKLNVDASKYQRMGTWIQVCPDTGC